MSQETASCRPTRMKRADAARYASWMTQSRVPSTEAAENTNRLIESCSWIRKSATGISRKAYIPGVDKIVGPGNAYVASAKRQVFGKVGIDMIAGPSEILIICDGSTDPDWVAMDMLAQSEHDEMAQAILLTPDANYADLVEASLKRLILTLPRRDVATRSLESRGALIQTRDLDEACDIANQIAPEHLEISVEQPERLVNRVRNAGAIFLGRYSSESLGDYCAGPNHVLPTSRSARFSSPLGVYDFQKRSSIIDVSRTGADLLGGIATILAEGEGLAAHARSAGLRILK